MQYILASAEHDHIVIAHYFAIWESYGTPTEYLRADADEVARSFLRQGRSERKLASFIAMDGDKPGGSVGVVCGRGRNPTLRLWPAIFSGEIDVFPSERRNMGQEIGR